MASGGKPDVDVDDSTSNGTETVGSRTTKPTYDGTTSLWPSFKVAAEAYMREHHMFQVVMHNKLDPR